MITTILVVEDDPNQRNTLTGFLQYKGFNVFSCEMGKKAIEYLNKKKIDVVLLDYKLPDMDGITLLKHIKERFPLTQVVIITAFASVENAVEAMKMGAYSYLTKPIHLDELILLIQKAVKEIKLEREVKRLKSELKLQKVSSHIISFSSGMKELLILAQKVAPTDATVLITGETGTGKSLLAKFLHELSFRKEAPFISINCAAIPSGLLESELFGYKKGAFTGAVKDKSGLFEIAHQGTIFLDEIGDMPLELQAKVLKVIQDKRFTRLGDTEEIEVDVRIIAATNKNLENMVEEQRFRQDLFWRLNVVSLKIPPLRKRKEDIKPLIDFFLKKFATKYNKTIKGLSKEALEALMSYSFPGNVRELENIIEHAVIMCDSNIITREDLPENIQNKTTIKVHDLFQLPLTEAVEKLEKVRILEAMKESKNIKTKAASLLGISERMLRYKLKKYNLED